MKFARSFVAAGALSVTLICTSAGFGISSSGAPGDGVPNGIVWYGVLTDGIAEAKATGKPIMFLSAAPQCTGVPGMW